jgi:hypothetical protein
MVSNSKVGGVRFTNAGLIFDPRQFVWDQDFIGFAQGPQALVFENFVRVYFSLRTDEGGGQFFSHVRYADFSPDMQHVLEIARHEVVPRPSVGSFDEHGIFPMNVVRVEDKIYAYSNGWSRRKSVPVETGIGLLVSNDNGQTFERVGAGPVLSATLHEPFLVGDPFVSHSPNGFRMWYIRGQEWIEPEAGGRPERVYKIAEAASEDGIVWSKRNRQLIPDVLGPDEAQALPSVVQWGGMFHMVFCYRQAFDFRNNPKNSYRLGYAKSLHSEVWDREDDALKLPYSETGWDSEMRCYPHAFEIGGLLRLLYNGNEFGRYGFGMATLAHTSGDA